ncbi:hypothetical protein [Vibrio agarivorans]|uniref:Uncharacterized protein n=1 Tax=Vibrio agarivorans TaxID=153622 RepID=A0ABT7Y7Y9_9VIBR|nr:hypothetical protein [Vibrio agarivorans]MDN2483874.1 hypothetical protein [Vibrio agarivorans]
MEKVVGGVKRFWKMGASLMEDELSNMPFTTAWRVFVQSNPKARHTVLFEEDGLPDENGNLVYEIKMLPPKTNG